MPVRRADYGSWMLRVLTWDAALPAVAAFTPAAFEAILPGRREPVEAVAVVLPIAAFFIRVRAGRRHIASNRCSTAARRLQMAVFCAGILPMVLMECAFALAGLMPAGALFASPADRMIWAGILAAYLLAMAVAMYPGRAGPDDPDDQIEARPAEG